MNWLMAVLVFLSLASANAAPLENQLRQHPSPYLALHGDDPVAWQEWNAASVERARRAVRASCCISPSATSPVIGAM